MKKALLSLLVLALVMIPVLVSCEDTSQLEKIGQLMSDFSGVNKKPHPEQVQKQTKQAISTIEEKFKEENLENLNFKEISDMFYDFPAANLKKETSIDPKDLNSLLNQITGKTEPTMTAAKEKLDGMVSSGELPQPVGKVAQYFAGKISVISDVFKDIKDNTPSTGEQATLEDIKKASAVASMCEAFTKIAEQFESFIGGTGMPQIQLLLLDDGLINMCDDYDNAAKAYAETVGGKASNFTIDLANLAGQFFGIN